MDLSQKKRFFAAENLLEDLEIKNFKMISET